MNAVTIAAVIAGAGFALSLSTTLVIVGIAYGRLRADVTTLQNGRAELATKEQVEGLAVQVAEIKGMFRVTLKTEHGGSE